MKTTLARFTIEDGVSYAGITALEAEAQFQNWEIGFNETVKTHRAKHFEALSEVMHLGGLTDRETAAGLLQCSTEWVRRLIETGRIRPSKAMPGQISMGDVRAYGNSDRKRGRPFKLDRPTRLAAAADKAVSAVADKLQAEKQKSLRRSKAAKKSAAARKAAKPKR